MNILKKFTKYRNFILITMDIFCIVFAYYLGTVLITETIVNFNQYYSVRLTRSILVSVFVYQIVFHITRRYKCLIRYEEGKDYVTYIVLC